MERGLRGGHLAPAGNRYIPLPWINKIEVPELLEALRKIEKRGALELAARARHICGQVFRYGIQTGRCKEDITQHLRGALKTRKVQHYLAIDTRELPELLAAVEHNEADLFDRTGESYDRATFIKQRTVMMQAWADYLDMVAATGKVDVPASPPEAAKDKNEVRIQYPPVLSAAYMSTDAGPYRVVYLNYQGEST